MKHSKRWLPRVVLAVLVIACVAPAVLACMPAGVNGMVPAGSINVLLELPGGG